MQAHTQDIVPSAGFGVAAAVRGILPLSLPRSEVQYPAKQASQHAASTESKFQWSSSDPRSDVMEQNGARNGANAKSQTPPSAMTAQKSPKKRRKVNHGESVLVEARSAQQHPWAAVMAPL